jgi:hypothetical protein
LKRGLNIDFAAAAVDETVIGKSTTFFFPWPSPRVPPACVTVAPHPNALFLDRVIVFYRIPSVVPVDST